MIDQEWGTGSTWGSDQGWHRDKRFADKIKPFTKPNLAIDSLAY
jgi:hypothetical protein